MNVLLARGRSHWLGSTGMGEILSQVVRLSEERIGVVALGDNCVAIESQPERPAALPSQVQFVSLDVPLDKLYENRHEHDGLPENLRSIPQRHWVRTTAGCGADLRTGQLAWWYAWKSVEEAREAAFCDASDLDRLRQAVQTSDRDLRVGIGDDVLSMYALSAAGSTGPGGLVRCVEEDLKRTDAYVVVLLAGANCGRTADDFRTQRSNARSVLDSLTPIIQKQPERVAVFYADGSPSNRAKVIATLGGLAWEMLYTDAGYTLRRELRNWVPQQAKSGRPIIFLNAWAQPSFDSARRRAALISLLQEIFKRL